jgi:hypothetical protein
MPRDWETWFQTASQPASATEEQQSERTVARVREAIAASSEIPNGSVRIYTKGSYKTNTNVRRDSDIDICVEWQSSFDVLSWGDTEGMTPEQLGYTRAHPIQLIAPADLRGRVERALTSYLGTGVVDTTGDKAIDVAPATGLLEADVIPCFWMRRYDAPGVYYDGQRIHPKSGGFIDNYPQQNYDNGVAKNTATGQRYKKVVRCFKKLETEMFVEGRIPRDYPGYLIECLLFNAPDDAFAGATMTESVIGPLRWLLNATSSEQAALTLREVNWLLWLFAGRSDRSVPNAAAFLRVVTDRLLEE